MTCTLRAVAVALLAACATALSHAQTRDRTQASVHNPPFPVTDLVRVGGNGVLAIDRASARAQLRADDGVWLPAIQLPFDQVTDIAARGSEVLIAGFDSGAVYAALFDAKLSLSGRWKLDDTLYVDLGAAGARQVSTASTRALLPSGGLGPSTPLLNTSDARQRMGRPALLETAAATIVCLPKDERKTVDAPASCERVTAPTWKISGNFSNPFLCGSWLIALAEHARTVEARAYAVDTGRLTASHAFAAPPTLTCVDDRQVVAIGPMLTLFTLPRFKLAGSASMYTGKSADKMFVPNVAVTRESIAYRVAGSNEVATVARPD